MKFFIESSTLRLEKDYPTKTDDDFWNIDEDCLFYFIDEKREKYETFDFVGRNNSIGYSLGCDNISEVEHQILFKEFTDFLDVNL